MTDLPLLVDTKYIFKTRGKIETNKGDRVNFVFGSFSNSHFAAVEFFVYNFKQMKCYFFLNNFHQTSANWAFCNNEH